MKRFLLVLAVAFFCNSAVANPPFNHYLQPTGAEGTNVAHEEFIQKLISDPFARSHFDSNKGYKSYVNRIMEQNQAYLDSKPSAEITVDEATGITTITWGDGAMYRGQTYYGEIKGVGTMVYPDGSKYCGQWERDLPNGYGTMLYPDGLAYSANFVNGVPHGKGVVEDADGNKFSARWVYGKLKVKSLKPYKE